MKREYPEHPIIGVGGVIFHDQSVLLVKRGQEPGKDQWSLPGGAVELGETLIDALNREIYEEVSIKIKVGGFLRLLDRIVHDGEKRVQYHYIIADYWGWMVSGQPQAASDASDARFVDPNEVQKMGVHKEVEETILLAVEKKNHADDRGPTKKQPNTNEMPFLFRRRLYPT